MATEKKPLRRRRERVIPEPHERPVRKSPPQPSREPGRTRPVKEPVGVPS